MKLSPTLFLKVLVVLAGLFIGSFLFIVIPEETDFSELGIMHYFVLAIYVSAIPFYLALYQTLKLLKYVDESRAFSELSVVALNYIKYCGIVISVIFALCLPFLFYLAQAADAPGVAAMGLVLTASPLAISTFSAVLQKVLHEALKMKSENELTV